MTKSMEVCRQTWRQERSLRALHLAGNRSELWHWVVSWAYRRHQCSPRQWHTSSDKTTPIPRRSLPNFAFPFRSLFFQTTTVELTSFTPLILQVWQTLDKRERACILAMTMLSSYSDFLCPHRPCILCAWLCNLNLSLNYLDHASFLSPA